MSHDSQIYKNGDAEFALLKAIYPFIAVMGLFAIGWHFGGFASQSTELDRAFAGVSAPLAWISLIALPGMGISILIANPPRVKLSPKWLLRTIVAAALAASVLVWLVSRAG